MEQQKAENEQKFDDWPAVMVAIFVVVMACAVVYAAWSGGLRDETGSASHDLSLQIQ